MKINTNTISLNAQNTLRQNQLKLESSMERLSSGKRINSAKDDAAGLAISERMAAKIRGQEVGVRNSNDGISLVQTAESALGNISNIIQRMRELAVQSANGTNTANDRASLDKEYQELLLEIDHIAGKTTFNGVDLLTATSTAGAGIMVQLSDTANDTMEVKTYQSNVAGLGLNGGAILTAATANTALAALDTALTNVSNVRAEYGANLNRLNFNIDNITSMSNNLAAAKSRIADADMAKEVSEMTKYKILTQSGMAMLSQANQNPQQVTQLLQQ